MKKKIIALILAAVTAISLMGCGNTNTNTQEAAETQDQTAAEMSRSRYRCRRNGKWRKYLSVYLCFHLLSVMSIG